MGSKAPIRSSLEGRKAIKPGSLKPGGSESLKTRKQPGFQASQLSSLLAIGYKL